MLPSGTEVKHSWANVSKDNAWLVIWMIAYILYNARKLFALKKKKIQFVPSLLRFETKIQANLSLWVGCHSGWSAFPLRASHAFHANQVFSLRLKKEHRSLPVCHLQIAFFSPGWPQCPDPDMNPSSDLLNPNHEHSDAKATTWWWAAGDRGDAEMRLHERTSCNVLPHIAALQ